jgi:hypothetical protein
MFKFISNPKVVSKTPIATVFFLESANVNQIIRMWTEHSAKGQSLIAWLCVSAALILWCNFYRVCCPEQKWALRTTLLGVFLNALVILSVIYFRYIY